jgi:hypothetical protein
MGLREIIGAATGGPAATWDAVARHIQENYLDNPKEIERLAEAQKRDEYYSGGGDFGIDKMIEKAFSDAQTKKLRNDLVSWAKWNNVLRRVAGELATVYNEPAKRKIENGDEQYQAFLDRLDIDGAMREVDEQLVIHEEIWVQYRVRAASAEPVLDIITPAKFYAVHDPADLTKLAAIVIDQKCSADVKQARWLVWTDEESFCLDGAKRFMGETLKPNPLKRMPGVLAATRPPSAKGRLLSQHPAADLVAAHEAIWFENTLLLKESKSANNQAYVTGDTSRAAMGQTADTEHETIMPEGVTVQTVDRGMNLEQFTKIADHVLERAAANRGLPPSVLHQRDAASGAEIHLRRIPLRELRKKRIPIMRRIERALSALMSLINANDLPDAKFDATGWRIDFGEVQQPLTELEQDQAFENQRRLGLTDTLIEIRRRNPDIKSDEEAEQILKDHLGVETKRVFLMKDLLAMNGSTSSEPGEPTAAENGEHGSGSPGGSVLRKIAEEVLNGAN